MKWIFEALDQAPTPSSDSAIGDSISEPGAGVSADVEAAAAAAEKGL